MRKVGKGPGEPPSQEELAAALARLGPALGAEGAVASYLFGSYGRWLKGGRAPGPLSDVDLAVLLPGPGTGGEPATPADLKPHLRLLAAAVDALGRDDVDLVILNQAPPALRYAVLRDGVRFWCADPDLQVNFEAAALRTYLDMEPYRRFWEAERVRRLREWLS